MEIIKKQVNVKPQKFEVEIFTINNLQIFIHFKNCFLPTVLSQNRCQDANFEVQA